MTTTTVRRRMKSNAVKLGLTALVASSLTGCGTDDGQAICVDPQTEVRVDDDDCDGVDEDYDGTGGGFYWFYIPSGHSAPGVGSRYNRSVGYYKAPSGTSFSKGGVATKGGSVSRGGFGGSFSSS
jgi:hypothetical protein